MKMIPRIIIFALLFSISSLSHGLEKNDNGFLFEAKTWYFKNIFLNNSYASKINESSPSSFGLHYLNSPIGVQSVMLIEERDLELYSNLRNVNYIEELAFPGTNVTKRKNVFLKSMAGTFLKIFEGTY